MINVLISIIEVDGWKFLKTRRHSQLFKCDTQYVGFTVMNNCRRWRFLSWSLSSKSITEYIFLEMKFDLFFLAMVKLLKRYHYMTAFWFVIEDRRVKAN